MIVTFSDRRADRRGATESSSRSGLIPNNCFLSDYLKSMFNKTGPLNFQDLQNCVTAEYRVIRQNVCKGFQKCFYYCKKKKMDFLTINEIRLLSSDYQLLIFLIFFSNLNIFLLIYVLKHTSFYIWNKHRINKLFFWQLLVFCQ